ncbi:hypothetical protein N6G93_01310 [Lactobacillus amylovorus]|nr:hypothetical protein [Lactobacillus amylovorus]UXN12118.1 hypothetical protein N6G93_01310 [Lactobacillus amylovorus]
MLGSFDYDNHGFGAYTTSQFLRSMTISLTARSAVLLDSSSTRGAS